MPDFTYTAWTASGKMERNTMNAANEHAVVDVLRGQGMTPSSVTLVKKSFDYVSILELIRPIKLLDKITLIKNLAVMIKAGLPVSRALRILTAQTPNPRFAKIVSEISRQVEGGTSLAEAMAKFPNQFSGIFISMVHVGESSGNLEQNLGYLGEQMQRDYDLMSKARGALTYPVIIMVALGIVGFLMFTFVLPKLTATFVESNVQLPFMTQVVVNLVNLFSNYGLYILAGTIFFIFGFMYWRKTSSGKKVIHKVVLYLPIFSVIIIKINLARFVRVFASLIKSGMPIVEALEISSNVVGNIYYQKIIREAAAKVKTGAPLTVAFKKEPKLFTNLVIQMMEVGEESGTTDVVLTEVAEFYEAELDQTMKNLSSILEPVIMMVIGTVVGFLAVALITPIYSITQSIN